MLGADFPMVMVRYGLLDSLTRGVSRTIDTVWFSLKMMGRMIVGDVSLRNVSGPVTIADYAGQTARIGFAAYIGFLALISRSEEHTSELQSLMRISYAVFCLKKKNRNTEA